MSSVPADTLCVRELGACPFCGGRIAVAEAEGGVLHALPICLVYAKLDVIEFLVAVRIRRGEIGLRS